MITTRNITIFFGLCGLAMALSGHLWPGAILMAVAVAFLSFWDRASIRWWPVLARENLDSTMEAASGRIERLLGAPVDQDGFTPSERRRMLVRDEMERLEEEQRRLDYD